MDDLEEIILFGITALVIGLGLGIIATAKKSENNGYKKVAESYTQTRCEDLEGETRFLCDGVVIDVLKLRSEK